MVKIAIKIASKGTANAIRKQGIDVDTVNKVAEGRPHIVDMIKNNEINLIINTTEGKSAIKDSASIRRGAEGRRVYYTTTLAGGEAVCMALKIKNEIKDISGKFIQKNTTDIAINRYKSTNASIKSGVFPKPNERATAPSKAP